MDIHQLRTFVAVAREGSVTRASELLHLSQPAVSAQIKALEDALDLSLFERSARGMSLTSEGERLLTKAEQTLAAHQELLDEAKRIKGVLSGRLRFGAGGSSNDQALGRLLASLAERCPEVEVVLTHGTSLEVLAGIRNGSLDAGFYNEAGEPAADLTTLRVSDFSIYVAAAPQLARASDALDWKALAELPWIYPPSSACCGRTAERLFKAHQIRPKRIISVDRESVTRGLLAGGVGVGLLHADTAREARARGEVELLFESQPRVLVLFAHLASRAQDPVLALATAMIRAAAGA